MRIKIKGIVIELKYMLIVLIILTIISEKTRNFLYYYIACYMFVMFHEFSHILVASIFRYKCRRVELSICGMSANIELGKNIMKNVLIFLAGPMSNIILAIIFYNNQFIFSINVVLAVVNLLPIYPLDGYRIKKALGIKNQFVEYITYFLLFILFIITKNLSIIIFLVYIILLKISAFNNDKYHC
ncbi:MAG: hypothetical protein IJ809_06040 [Clostridia bacterium]|nr:hypothetical protein [Clostridia bacterium]